MLINSVRTFALMPRIYWGCMPLMLIIILCWCYLLMLMGGAEPQKDEKVCRNLFKCRDIIYHSFKCDKTSVCIIYLYMISDWIMT